MNSDPVFHNGTITAINKNIVHVRLDNTTSAECGGCAMSLVCGKDRNNATVDARVARGVSVAPGVKVRVKADPDARTRASFLLLVLPAMAFLAGIIAALLFGTNEATALATGTVTSIVCFVILYLTDGKTGTVWTVTGICE